MSVEIPQFPELSFDEAHHIYRLNGLVIPSVTMPDCSSLHPEPLPKTRSVSSLPAQQLNRLTKTSRQPV